MPREIDHKLQPNQIQILITVELDPEDHQAVAGVGMAIRPEFEEGDPVKVSIEMLTLLLSNIAPHVIHPDFRTESPGELEYL